ncbi:MAG TPA: DUF2760 domain-containing protein [Planctomycetes bacterium]|nr:DUF2760 domain-containing protein [Planctomycetota bacterium]
MRRRRAVVRRPRAGSREGRITVGRWRESWRIFRRCLKDAAFRGRVQDLGDRRKEDILAEGAARLLACLQQDGRLVDFLREDIDGYDDAQVGAAARSMHRSCRRALDKVVTLAAVIEGRERSPVTVPEGFDALAITIEGNLGARPPLRGVLLHPGWKAVSVALPPVARGRDPALIAPAEVEVK